MTRLEHEHRPGQWLRIAGRWSSPEEATRDMVSAGTNPSRLRARNGPGPWIDCGALGIDPPRDAEACDRCDGPDGIFYPSAGSHGEPAPLCRTCAAADPDLRFPSWDYPPTETPLAAVTVDPAWQRKRCAEDLLRRAADHLEGARMELEKVGASSAFLDGIRIAEIRARAAALQAMASDPVTLAVATLDRAEREASS